MNIYVELSLRSTCARVLTREEKSEREMDNDTGKRAKYGAG